MPYVWPPTLSESEDALNMSHASNAELQGVLDAAVAVLENHPEYRVKDAVGQTDFTEWPLVSGGELILSHYPVDPDSITVTEYNAGSPQVIAYEPSDGDTFTGYGFTTKDGTGESGILLRTSGGVYAGWCGRVKVEYTAGAADVPADLRQAVLKLAKHMWRDQRGSGSGRSIPGDVNPDEVYLADVSPHLLPLEVEQMLAPYRKAPVVA